MPGQCGTRCNAEVLKAADGSGGLYVHGDLSQMTLPLGAASTQAITLQQTDAGGYPVSTLVTLNPLLNQTIVAVTQSPGPLHLPLTATTIYSGATNGVVYCDGNIGGQTTPKTGGLNGIIADNQVLNGGGLLGQNRLTITTAAGKNININGSLIYNTPRLVDVNGQPLSAGWAARRRFNPASARSASTTGCWSSTPHLFFPPRPEITSYSPGALQRRPFCKRAAHEPALRAGARASAGVGYTETRF